jgi:4-hydroxybenzoate polyprenyltransferase
MMQPSVTGAAPDGTRRSLSHRILTMSTGAIGVTHPFPATVVVTTTLILVVIAHGGNPGLGFLARCFGVILTSQIAVGALNDYLDREIDAVTQPDKPIPAGLVGAPVALALTIISLTLLLPLAATFGAASLGLMALATASGLAYDLWLKPTPFSVVAYLVSFLTLVTWIWEVAGRFTPLFVLVYPAGAAALLAAHLANSYPDVETDRALGQAGLAALLGPVWTFRILLIAYGSVAVAGLATAVVQRRPVAVGLLAAAAAIGLLAWVLCRQAPDEAQLRDRLFRLVAPGIALIAVGCLLAINSS